MHVERGGNERKICRACGILVYYSSSVVWPCHIYDQMPHSGKCLISEYVSRFLFVPWGASLLVLCVARKLCRLTGTYWVACRMVARLGSISVLGKKSCVTMIDNGTCTCRHYQEKQNSSKLYIPIMEHLRRPIKECEIHTLSLCEMYLTIPI